MSKRIGDFQISLLQCLVLLGGKAKGFEIENCLEELLGKEVLAPQVLGALQRLERRSFVKLAGSEKGEKGGRPRNVYEITDAGREILRGTLIDRAERQKKLDLQVLASPHLAGT